MRAKKRAGSVGKFLGCAVLLVVALFPIYWLLAMAIRPTDEMTGHISLIPHALTIEHFAKLFTEKGFGTAIVNSLQTTLVLWCCPWWWESARHTCWPDAGSISA